MSAQLQRARLLREHRRHEEAVAMLYEYLGASPEDAYAYVELAMNRMAMPGERTKALDDINAAIALEPDDAAIWALKVSILVHLDREKEALPVAERAIALAPESSFVWEAKAEALGALMRWSDGERAAQHALQLDPDSQDASNLLALFLRMQDKLDESDEVSRRRLERDPENAFSLATAGWASLQRGDHNKAEELFLESLRLDPEFEHARLGLREAYKARSPVYRLYLRWGFFMQRHTEGRQWMIVIGIYLAFRFGRVVLAAIHPLLAVPLVLAYLLFAFGGWLASGLGNFLLLKDPKARLSLNHSEKLDGLAVGGLFFGGLLMLLFGAATSSFKLAIFGAVMMGASVPASLVFSNSSKKGQVVFGGLTLLVILCGLGAIMNPAELAGTTDLFNKRGSTMITISLLGIIGTTWLGMIPSLRRGMEE